MPKPGRGQEDIDSAYYFLGRCGSYVCPSQRQPETCDVAEVARLPEFQNVDVRTGLSVPISIKRTTHPIRDPRPIAASSVTSRPGSSLQFPDTPSHSLLTLDTQAIWGNRDHLSTGDSCMRTIVNRAAAAALPPAWFTVAEAAWAVRTPEHFINTEIDKKIITARIGGHVRLLDRSSLSYLRAIREFRNSMAVELRRRIYREVCKALKENQIGHVMLDTFVLHLDKVLTEIDQRIRDIIEVRSSIEYDPCIRGLVAKGARIPVQVLGEVLRNGVAPADIARAYDLSMQQVELVFLYDRLHPRRGRPARSATTNCGDTKS